MSKSIQDPLFGYIDVDGVALKIIDTPEFDRLRYIKQLAFAHYVFPSATHNRFVHSLQVYHVAKKWCRALNIEKEEASSIEIAALIHDIGHVVGCHTFDDTVATKLGLPDHEERTSLLFRHVCKKYNLDISEEKITLICNIVRGVPDGIHPNYMFQIVANHFNEFDVDKIYLKMDGYSLGTSYNLQEERIFKNTKIIDGDICFDEKVRFLVYEFYYRRYKEFKEILKHHACISAEMVLKDMLWTLDDIFDFKEIFKNFEWLNLTDSVLESHRMLPLVSDPHKKDLLRKLSEYNEILSTRQWKKLLPYSTKDGDVHTTVSLSGGSTHPMKNIYFYRKGYNDKFKIIDDDAIGIDLSRHREKLSWKNK